MKKTTSLFYPRYLWLLILSYSILLIMANWFNTKLLLLHGFIVPAGILVFPFTFLLSDIITEVYGFKSARLAIWAAFFFNLLFILFGQLVVHLPSPANLAANNDAFARLLQINLRVTIASFISYLIAEPLNSYLVSKLKVVLAGRHVGVRYVLSTFLAAGLDSFLFIFIAFYGYMPTLQLFLMSVHIWIIKVVVEIIGLPASLFFTRFLKRKEKLDVYDTNTHYNLFALETHYEPEHNHFRKEEK